jgi:predicted P-loop ATPase
MKLATAGSRWSRRWKTEDWFWEALVERLRTPARTGETVREYQAMTKDEKTAKKDVGGFVGGAINGGRRVVGAVTERWLVTLDADYAEPGDWENFTALNDMRCCVYSTHSHTPEHPKLRWVLPLKRAVSPEEYGAVARKVAEWIGIEKMDPLTYQPERLMFWPSCSDDAEYYFKEQDGPALDPDAVLRTYGPDEAWRDVTLWPTSSREGEVVRREQRMQADPLTKPGLVGAFCRTYTVEDAIDAFDLPYERCDGVSGERYTYTHGSTAAGAVVYGDGRWLYSNHATDPAGGQLCNAWDLVRVHKFADLDADSKAADPTKLPSYKAMTDLVAQDERVRRTLIDNQFGDIGISVYGEDGGGSIAPVKRTTTAETTPTTPTTPTPPQETADDGVGAGDDGDDDDKSWTDLLVLNKKTGLPEPTLDNACVILEYAPQFRGRLAFCEQGEQIYVTAPMPWEDKIKRTDTHESEAEIMGDDWTETGSDGTTYKGPPHAEGRVWTTQDSVEMYRWFERRFGYSAMQKRNGGLDNALLTAAKRRSFNPIYAYLKGLHWDGVERLDTMLIRWMGAEDCELNRVVTRLWMMGAVDRVIRPGGQFDSVLVFKGPQGIGKTRMMRALVGEYYTNAVRAATIGKESAEIIQGMWVVDLDEIDSVTKSSVTAFKAFITSPSDRYRKAYAIDAESHPRQCVFFGTTNTSGFLRDETGERRYWIVPCEGQKGMTERGVRGTLPGFDDEVEQLWAEAVYRWRERIRECRKGTEPLRAINAKLYITDERLGQEMDARLGDFKLADPDRDDIEEYLEKPLPDNWETMSQKDRDEFEDGYLIVDERKLTGKRQTVTLKEIRLNVFGDSPKRAAGPGRTSTACRIVSIMDNMPGWECVGNIHTIKDGVHSRSKTWRRVEEEK